MFSLPRPLSCYVSKLSLYETNYWICAICVIAKQPNNMVIASTDVTFLCAVDDAQGGFLAEMDFLEAHD